jgi:hypothetical protein
LICEIVNPLSEDYDRADTNIAENADRVSDEAKVVNEGCTTSRRHHWILPVTIAAIVSQILK